MIYIEFNTCATPIGYEQLGLVSLCQVSNGQAARLGLKAEMGNVAMGHASSLESMLFGDVWRPLKGTGKDLTGPIMSNLNSLLGAFT